MGQRAHDLQAGHDGERDHGDAGDDEYGADSDDRYRRGRHGWRRRAGALSVGRRRPALGRRACRRARRPSTCAASTYGVIDDDRRKSGDREGQDAFPVQKRLGGRRVRLDRPVPNRPHGRTCQCDQRPLARARTTSTTFCRSVGSGSSSNREPISMYDAVARRPLVTGRSASRRSPTGFVLAFLSSGTSAVAISTARTTPSDDSAAAADADVPPALGDGALAENVTVLFPSASTTAAGSTRTVRSAAAAHATAATIIASCRTGCALRLARVPPSAKFG